MVRSAVFLRTVCDQKAWQNTNQKQRKTFIKYEQYVMYLHSCNRISTFLSDAVSDF